MSKRLFHAAKINVHENIFSQDLKELISIHIPRVILEAPSFRFNSYTWSFTDVKEVILEGERIITGNVTRSKQAKHTVRIGQVTEKIKTDYEIAQTAYFVYHPQSEILVHEVNSYIVDLDFRSFFSRLLGRDPIVGDVVIQPIPEPHKIREELKLIQKVTSVHFHFIHPNPGKDEYNIYQRIINANKSRELDLKMGNKEGLQLNDSNHIEQLSETIEDGISLIESGYGSIDIKGYDVSIALGKRKDRIIKKKKSFSSRKSVRMIKTNDVGEERLLLRIVRFILDVKEKVIVAVSKDEEQEQRFNKY